MHSLFNVFENRFNIIEEDLKVFNLYDHWIVTNHVTNGWVVLSLDEINLLFHPKMTCTNETYLMRLYKCGIIKNNEQYINSLPNKINEEIIYFELNVTNSCNLQCSYCVSNFNYNIECINMSEHTADNFCEKIDQYLNINKSSRIVIEFSGGEPFLNFNIIKHVIQKLQKNETIYFVIQTNGTLLNNTYLKFLSKVKNVEIALSLDGFNEKHNVNRFSKDTSEKILMNLEKLKRENIKCNIVSVVSESNINDLDKIVLWFIKKNLNFSLLPLLPFGKAKSNNMNLNIANFINKLWEINDICKNHYDKDKTSVLERNLGTVFSYLVQPLRKFMCNRSPCGAGINIISISPKGNIYPCYGFQGINEYMIGSINSDLNFNDISQHSVVLNLKNRIKENIADCSSCNYNIWCYGGCASNSLLNYDNLLHKDTIHCEIQKQIITRSLHNIISNQDTDYMNMLGSQWAR